jgi:hypothetical protein
MMASLLSLLVPFPASSPARRLSAEGDVLNMAGDRGHGADA